MRHVSLFTGIGGIDAGFEMAGMETVLQVERDPFCLAVLRTRWPGVPKLNDVSKVTRDTCPECEIVSGGFPCQPFSVAGQRRGKADARWLWPEMRRIIGDVRPRWVFAENVPGIINLALDDVLDDLEAIGYTARAIVIPACGVGAPHRRMRVCIVAHADRQREQQQADARVEGGNRTDDSGEVLVHTVNPGRQDRPLEREPDAAGEVEREAGSSNGAAASRPGQNVADPQHGRRETWRPEAGRSPGPAAVGLRPGCRAVLADTAGEGAMPAEQPGPGDGLEQGSAPCPNPEGERLEDRGQARGSTRADEENGEVAFTRLERCGRAWWETEPGLGRVAHGIPHQVDRTERIGAAAVPQLMYEIGRMIMHVDRS